MRWIATVFMLFAASGCTTLERQFLPSAELKDPLWAQHGEEDWRRIDHSAWTELLQTYVSTDAAGINRVDYGGVTKADKAALERYLARMERVQVRVLTRPEQLAFWINLYNAKTVDIVLEHYPVDSIRDINPSGALISIGPWDEPVIEVDGRRLSLNDIEHGIIRPVWQDPRVHYILNCAASGCPNLAKEAYRGADIDARMSEAARAHVNDPRGARFTEEGRLVVSKIYSWFREDFGGDEAAVLDHLRRYAETELEQRLEDVRAIDGYAYDWSLNDLRHAAVSARGQIRDAHDSAP